MTVQPVGDGGAALSFTCADLVPYGFAPACLTREQALRLTRDGLLVAGLDLRGALEVEAYPSDCGVLILARSAPRLPARPLPVRTYRRGRLPHHST